MAAPSHDLAMLERNRLRPLGAAYLRRCLEGRGATVTAIAGELGISRKHLSNILGGRAALEEPLLTRLCRALGADPALIRPLAAPHRPATAGHGALAGSIRVVGDLTEPIDGWEIAAP